MYSMTGFGKGTCAVDGRELTVELKSVNNRFLDISMRLPRTLGALEEPFRRAMQQRLNRGHVDVFVNYRNTRSDARCVYLDTQLMGAYVQQARKAAEELSLTDDLTLSKVLSLPDVAEIVPGEEDEEALLALGEKTVNLAIDALLKMRLGEGERLKLDLQERIERMEGYAVSIEKRAPGVAEDYRRKLTERIEELVQETEVDRSRLATEIALFADRAAIDEEIVRLKSHLVHFRELLEAQEPVGRKMDFLIQEMNRECNTIGSKANDAALTDLVLLCKAEIEKLREQIQNIE